jgi:pterin-4a-carbinolamine dehydratase
MYTAKDETSGDTKTSNKKIKIPKKYTLSNFDEAVAFLEGLEQ